MVKVPPTLAGMEVMSEKYPETASDAYVPPKTASVDNKEEDRAYEVPPKLPPKPLFLEAIDVPPMPPKMPANSIELELVEA